MKLLILIAGLCAGGINGYCETPHISCAGLDRNLSGQGPKFIVVDVRTAADYKRSHILGERGERGQVLIFSGVGGAGGGLSW